MSSNYALDRFARKATVHTIKRNNITKILTPPNTIDARHPGSIARRYANRPTVDVPFKTLQDFFINALVRAGSCQSHVRNLSTWGPRASVAAMQVRTQHASTSRREHRFLQTDRFPRGLQPRPSNISKRELKNLVDIYEDADVSGQDILWSGGSFLSGKIEQDPREYVSTAFNPHTPDLNASSAPPEPPQQRDLDHLGFQSIINTLSEQIRDKTTTIQTVYETFSQLPQPRVKAIPFELLESMLHRLGSGNRDRNQKDIKMMIAYLSIIDEMKATGLPISMFLWNIALHYATSELDWIGSGDARAALKIWKEMEVEHKLQGDHITLTILYNVCAKAGLYALADRIWRLLHVRGLPVNRITKTAQMYAYGLRKDGHRVRKCYTKFVEDGEIVDTSVLNCVMAALIAADEFPAAEEVFHRMKQINAERLVRFQPSRTKYEQKKMTRLLIKAREIDDLRTQIQDICPIAPDRYTYRILIRYLAMEGEYERCVEFIGDMLDEKIPMQYGTFHILFEAFERHGGVPLSSWTTRRLQSTWAAYIKFVEHDRNAGANINIAQARGIVGAFAKCISKDEALVAWKWLLQKWTPNDQESAAISRDLSQYPEGGHSQEQS